MNSKKILHRMLILLFIFWILYHFFDFKLSKIFSFFNNNVKKPNSEFPKITEHLDNYLKTLTATDKNLKDITLDNNTVTTPSKYSEVIIKNLSKLLTVSDKYQIKNIKLLDKLKEQKTNLGYYYLPFRIEGEYYFNKKLVSKVVLQLELQVILDKKDDIFIGPVSVYDQSGVLKISRIHLINNNEEIRENIVTNFSNNHIKIEEKEEKIELSVDSEKNESMKNKIEINLDIDYDVSKEFQDSLIPDKINFTDYQSTSNNETSKVNKPQYL